MKKICALLALLMILHPLTAFGEAVSPMDFGWGGSAGPKEGYTAEAQEDGEGFTEQEIKELWESGEAAPGELVFLCDGREEAEEICRSLGGSLESWDSGVAVMDASGEEDAAVYALSEPRDSGAGLPEVEFYPNLVYTTQEDYAEETAPADGTVEAQADPDSDISGQWHHAVIGTASAWSAADGSGVLVAVVDTGISLTHPLLASAISGALTVIPSSYYENSTFPTDFEGVLDHSGHGTHVAGIIAAQYDPENKASGIAPGCSILSIKALEAQTEGGAGAGYTSWVVAAINRAVSEGADIINLSVGGTQKYDSLFEAAISGAVENGVVVVAAAGNYSSTSTAAQNSVDYPAKYANAIAVSAVRASGGSVEFASSYSRYGSEIDIAAPGSSVKSCSPDGGYVTKTGTSMAAPMVSAAAALLLSVDPTLTPEEVKTSLCATAADMGNEGRDDYYGSGLLNIAALINAASGGELYPPVCSVPDGSIVHTGYYITLRTVTAGAEIRFTTDGSAPDEESGLYPSAGIEAADDGSGKLRLRAVSVTGDGMSEELDVSFTLRPGVITVTSAGAAGGVLYKYGNLTDEASGLPCQYYEYQLQPGRMLKATASSLVFSPRVVIRIKNTDGTFSPAQTASGKLLASAVYTNTGTETVTLRISCTQAEALLPEEGTADELYAAGRAVFNVSFVETTPVRSIVISAANGGDMTVRGGGTLLLKATVSPADATVKEVYWFFCEDGYGLGSISNSGRITMGSISEPTTFHVKAIAVDADHATAYAEITVLPGSISEGGTAAVTRNGGEHGTDTREAAEEPGETAGQDANPDTGGAAEDTQAGEAAGEDRTNTGEAAQYSEKNSLPDSTENETLSRSPASKNIDMDHALYYYMIVGSMLTAFGIYRRRREKNT